MFTFCPLQGAQSESTASQSILELDGGVKVLIDVGWDESFDTEKLQELEKQVPTLSLILLTQATIPHLAAYAHCCRNFPLFTRIPIYATRPVIDLGRSLLQDLYSTTPLAATTIPRSSLAQVSYSTSQALPADQDFLLQPPTPEEIAKYFSLIRDLKYSQPTVVPTPTFSSPLNGLTITAYNSGRSLGGTIWHIQHGLESIVYACDWGQYKENVFSGAAWMGGHGGGSEVIEALRKPTALVCSSKSPNIARPGERDQELLATARLALERGGTVLIPVNSDARVVELAYFLEHEWRKDSTAENAALSRSKLFLAGRGVNNVMRHARSMLEWMNEGIVQEFEIAADTSRRVNGSSGGSKGKEAGPFDFRHLRLLERKAQVEKLLGQELEGGEGSGRIILASDTSLEWGFSKDVLKRIADDPRNMVILTEVPNLSTNNRPSLARTLWGWWAETNGADVADKPQSSDPVSGNGREVEVTEVTRQALAGEELTLYQQWLATQRQLQATLQTGGGASLEAAADLNDDISSESSSDSDESDNEQQGKALNLSTTIGQASRKKVVLTDEDLGINILLKKKGVYDFDVRNRKGRERMFPVTIRRRRNDEFGELIRPEDYLRSEEREEEENEAQATGGGDQDNLGKKRKWDDIATNKTGSGTGKRPQLNRAASVDDQAADAAPDGPADDLDDAGEDEEDQPLGPSKLITSKEKLAIKLRIAYVDYSGLHSERNLEMLLPLIQPRKLILIGGSSRETAAVTATYKNIVSTSRGVSEDEVDVLTPEIGTTVDASVDTNAWVVRLADQLVKRLKWQNLRGLGIVTLTGQLLGPATAAAKEEEEESPSGHHHEAGDEEGANKRIKTESGDHNVSADSEDDPQHGAKTGAPAAALPTLDVLPTAMTSAARSAAAQPLHVGDLRLADLRRAMQSSGHTAEFRGEGTLVVDGAVAVRKTTTGRVEVESIGLPTDGGPATQVGGTFYAVKKMIYDGLAVVAGG
ncbi:uncharacterized protein E0L32_010219 [Thyridium curvatum]|uniref:Cleavage and polyadenylation specificity factor subunit 2 n=1 Tax=Thyridium curvatum TaxID=1093900 RepID=A0A507AGW6_9PEZI|nr:uncharacterized protein E0L32_010219 [Thyridium curvatum]TPX08152.1 hypothetical protein E0L32_010219 [Thyridium curvatum]